MINDLPIAPLDAAKLLLTTLPAKRMRDVVERRFGLKGRRRATLQAIGGLYKITRERVRQIERDAMGRLRREEHPAAAPLFTAVEAALREHGGVMARHHLFSSVAPDRSHAALHFLLQASPRFAYFPETDGFHPRWAISATAAQSGEQMIADASARLAQDRKTFRQADIAFLNEVENGAQRLSRVQVIIESGLESSPRGAKFLYNLQIVARAQTRRAEAEQEVGQPFQGACGRMQTVECEVQLFSIGHAQQEETNG